MIALEMSNPTDTPVPVPASRANSVREIISKFQTYLKLAVLAIIAIVFIFSTLRSLVSPINGPESVSSENIMNKLVNLLEAVDGDLKVFQPRIGSLTWNETNH